LSDFKTILSDFKPVSLEEIEEVKLMNRIDRKYWFHISKLNQILEFTLADYDVLEINGLRLMEYQTTYFDTPENTMYLKHHNRKLNRHKVRQRKYVSTNSSFLEIKLKTNKKRTIKKRIAADFERTDFSNTEMNFIKEKSMFQGDELYSSLNNKFNRITLIHKNKLDRCTIDISPKFWNNNGEVKFDNLVVFELKRGRSLKSSPMVSLLRKLQIRQRGLSKYCTGRAMLEPELKQNAFKPRLRFLNKEVLN
jgi:hypothetical protein